MGYARQRKISLTGTSQQSPWCSMKRGGMLTLEGTWVGTVSLVRRGADGNTVPATNNSGAAITYTTNGTYALSPNLVQAEYAVQCTAYTSGTITGILEGL